ncbi:MAG: haloacid dehalogenase [Candidatus Promineifilaceae bacterium]
MAIEQLESITDSIRDQFEAVQAARDLALKRSRELIRICAKAIRAMHRSEWDSAEAQLQTAHDAAKVLIDGVKDYPALYFAGYTQDSLKELVEASLVSALMQDRPFPTPQELNVEGNTYLNGMAEAATELRRRILDMTRHGYSTDAEVLLEKMDEIYSYLVTFDFTDSITGGLRRRTDTVRGVLERTRGDLTTTYRQTQLETALKALETKLGSDS